MKNSRFFIILYLKLNLTDFNIFVENLKIKQIFILLIPHEKSTFYF